MHSRPTEYVLWLLLCIVVIIAVVMWMTDDATTCSELVFNYDFLFIKLPCSYLLRLRFDPLTPSQLKKICSENGDNNFQNE